MESDLWIILCFIIVSLFIGMIIGNIFITDIPMQRKSLDEVCIQLTGNETAIFSIDIDYSTYWGNNKLVCDLPSYDSTQEIIIKSNLGRFSNGK